MLDCYMGRCVRKDVSCTITTRTAESNMTFILEIEDERDNTLEADRDWQV